MSASSKLSLKLLIDQTTNRVVFAEAGKETIDFLFSILTLPVGTIVGLLSKQDMVGSFVTLYKSVENLNVEYLQPNQNKDSILLKPNAAFTSTTQEIPNLFLLPNSVPKKSKFYLCPYENEHDYVAEKPQTHCPDCRRLMTLELSLVGESREVETAVEGGGFVKGVVTYMIMDDLSVKPMSTISSIALLKELNVTEVDALSEKVVYLDMDKGLKLLKTAFKSKEVLTSVFLLQDEVPRVAKKKKTDHDPNVMDA